MTGTAARCTVRTLALALLALPAIFAWAQADRLSGGGIGRMIAGCAGMTTGGMMGAGMMGGGEPPNQQWR